MKLRAHLSILVVATLVPMVAYGVAAATLIAEREAQVVERGALDRTRALITAIDRELKAHLLALDALVQSAGLEDESLEAFDENVARLFAEEAARASQRQTSWKGLSLLAVDGRVIGETTSSDVRSAAGAHQSPSFQLAVGMRAPVIGDLGESDGDSLIPVRMPISRNGRVRGVLSARIDPSSVQQILAVQGLASDWIGSVVDASGRIVARTRDDDATRGKFSTESFRAAMAASDAGWFRGQSLDGKAIYTAFARSPETRWAVALGIPAAVVERTGAESRGLLIWGVLVASLTAAGLARWLIHRISEPIVSLARMVESVPTGVPSPPPDATRVLEVHDVSRALVDAANAVRERENRLIAADKAKDQFLAMLGHELRNPLSALASAAQLLQMAPAPDEHSRAAQAVIARQVRHMTRLIDDLLDVGRVTRGKVRLAPERLDLAEAVRAVLRDLETGGRLREHELVTELAPAWIDADGARVEQIITNLVVNAEKYTPAGGRITVRVRREGDDAVLDVSDTGVGLSPELLPRVFELFVQGERSIDRSSGGLGLGLTLVKGLAELHGGSVSVHSDGLDRGARFTVRLPAADGPARVAQPRRAPAARRSRRVLVVEDNEDARRSLATALRLRGHEVEEAADGREGVERALGWAPAVALVDIGLPELDGLELARRVRSDPRGQAVRLIAMSGYSEQEMGGPARDAGFDAYLAKPLMAPALFELIERGPGNAAREGAAR